MIKLGQYNTLDIERNSPHGLYLSDELGNEVLLPNKFVTDDMKIGDELTVFIYKDAQDRRVATTEEPLLVVGKIALLEVFDVSNVGAFVDWGVEKHLLIPFSEQGKRLQAGHQALVYMYLDEDTHRLVGTTKITKHLKGDINQLEIGQAVDLLMWYPTELGYTAIIENEYIGLVYHDDIYERIRTGEERVGYIKRIREDGKIDLSLRPFGYNKVNGEADKILEYLHAHDGIMSYTDKSSPDEISRVFKMSKKVFKKSLGLLYKQKRIVLHKDRTELNKK